MQSGRLRWNPLMHPGIIGIADNLGVKFGAQEFENLRLFEA